MQRFRPHPSLASRVHSIEIVEAGDRDVTVLPSASAVLGVQLRGRVRAGPHLLTTAGVTGIQQSARTYTYLGDTTSILVRFTPQGATCLGVPAAELSDRSVALDDLLPARRVRELGERLAAVASPADGVRLVEALLLELPAARDTLVARALDLLDPPAGAGASVAAVARALGVSERQLERRFLARVGVTPKGFATLRRFERAVEAARSSPSLAAAALQAGYYDQSHFIRDFRRFAGATPGEFLRASR